MWEIGLHLYMHWAPYLEIFQIFQPKPDKRNTKTILYMNPWKKRLDMRNWNFDEIEMNGILGHLCAHIIG